LAYSPVHPPRPQVLLNPTLQAAKPAITGSRELILGNDALMNLRFRSDLVTEFPFLRAPLPKAPPRCGSCRQRGAMDRQQYDRAVNDLKMAVLGLPVERLARLKALLGVDTLILYFRASRGIEKRVL